MDNNKTAITSYPDNEQLSEFEYVMKKNGYGSRANGILQCIHRCYVQDSWNEE